jgi:hypothetical protein
MIPAPRTTALFLACATLAGCATSSKPPLAVPAPTIADTEFPAAASILQGIEVDTEPSQLWHVGDRILLGITVTRHEETTTLYMETEIAGTPSYDRMFVVTGHPKGRPSIKLSSFTCKTRIRLYDETGKLIQESDGRVPTMILNCGPFEAAAEEVRIRNAEAEGHKREDQAFHERSMIGFMVFLTFGQSSRRNSVLENVVGRVARRPSLIELVLDPTLSFSWSGAGPTPLPDARLGETRRPAYRVPMEVSAAGKVVANTALTIVPSTRPIGLCGGVIEADVQHPSEQGTHAHMRLLGAKRGDGPAVPVFEPIRVEVPQDAKAN